MRDAMSMAAWGSFASTLPCRPSRPLSTTPDITTLPPSCARSANNGHSRRSSRVPDSVDRARHTTHVRTPWPAFSSSVWGIEPCAGPISPSRHTEGDACWACCRGDHNGRLCRHPHGSRGRGFRRQDRRRQLSLPVHRVGCCGPDLNANLAPPRVWWRHLVQP
jgi:hypothetical protein